MKQGVSLADRLREAADKARGEVCYWLERPYDLYRTKRAALAHENAVMLDKMANDEPA